mgnify:CR=1 FL=1
MTLLFSRTPQREPGTEDVVVFPAELLPALLASRAPARPEALIAYGSVEQMGAAFACGCADFLADPWLPDELFHRAVRVGEKGYIDFPGGRIEIAPFALMSGNVTVALSRQEHLLLRLLARHIDTPVPRELLLRELGPLRAGEASRAVDVHIAVLRGKLRLCGMGGLAGNPIRAVRGVGYALVNGL